MGAPPVQIQERLARLYLDLRAGIGIVGIVLPIFLFVGNQFEWRSSISSYYYTGVRDFLVGGLFAVGVFLLCYRFERADTILSNIAGGLAIGVAVFPTKPATDVSTADEIVGVLHVVCAAGFFVLLAVFCLWLFTKSDQPKEQQTAGKRRRNRLYRACGLIILGCLLVAVVSALFVPESVNQTLHPLLFAEAFAIFAFGVAWFVKGDHILKDGTRADEDLPQGQLLPLMDPEPSV